MLRLVLALLLLTPLYGQETAFEGEVVQVTLVEVPVQVLDKEGDPIVKLKKEDFTLKEDGVVQPIAHFYEVQDSVLLRKRFADELIARYGTPPTPEFHKRIIIFVDAYHVDPLHFKRVKKSLESFIQKVLMPGDSLMIVEATPSLTVVLPWEKEKNKILQTIKTLKSPGVGVASRRTREHLLAYSLRRSRRYYTALAELRGYINERRQEILAILEGLKATVESHGRVPGQKMMLFITEGLPTIPGLEYFYLLDRRFPTAPILSEAVTYDLTRDYQDMARYVASREFTLYTLDARGLILPTPEFDAELSGIDYLERSDVSGASIAAKDSQDSLRMMAETTGGSAVVNVNDFEVGLSRIALKANHHYLLGFYPSHPPDGKYHTIKVEVSNPEFRTTHRKGYINWRREDTFSQKLKAALLWPITKTPPFDLKLTIGKPKKDGRYYQVPLQLAIPIEVLQGKEKQSLQLGIVVGDGKGRQSNVFIQDLILQKKDFKDKTFVAYQLNLRMRKGKQTLVVALEGESLPMVFLKTPIKVK